MHLNNVMRPAYTNTKVINGQSTTLQKLCRLLLCFGMLGIAAAVVYSVINNKLSTHKSAPVAAQLPYGSIEELSDPKTVSYTHLTLPTKA